MSLHAGASDTPTRLARRLGLTDAVVIGLGAMIGAGVFAAIGPAARAAGPALLAGLVIAGFVAYANATSSAQLAALYPESGGTYVYGQKRLGHFWGFIAGWGFVIGKVASCAAMALTFASYAAPHLARPLAIGAVVAIVAVNYVGVRATALVTRAIVAVVLGSLAVAVAALLTGGQAGPHRLWPHTISAYGILQSAALLFFAFAGYARIATLGEEVIDPQRTIPRAIPIALGVTLVVYAAVASSALVAVDIDTLASSVAPLAAAVEAGRTAWLSPVVRIGAAIASLGVLLSLVAGVSRTLFAMAANGDMPRALAAVHPRYRVPHRAELAVGVGVVALVATIDIGNAIGFSSFAVLAYYGIANAAALTLGAAERRWPRWLAMSGLTGCAVLALSLPPVSVIGGSALLLAGATVYALRSRFTR